MRSAPRFGKPEGLRSPQRNEWNLELSPQWQMFLLATRFKKVAGYTDLRRATQADRMRKSKPSVPYLGTSMPKRGTE